MFPIASALQSQCPDLSRRMLGFGTRFDQNRFLKQHEVWLEYSVEDLDGDLGTAEWLWQERQAEVARGAARERLAG